MRQRSTLPKWLLLAAILLFAIWAIAHVAGLREHVSILSGTIPAVREDAFWGLSYAMSWFGAVLVAPNLALGGGLRFVIDALRVRRRARSRAATDATAQDISPLRPSLTTPLR